MMLGELVVLVIIVAVAAAAYGLSHKI